MQPSLKTIKRVYPTIEKCIYCFKPEALSELTDEHIIPSAINGGQIIRNAVCKVFQRIVNEPENDLLKDEFKGPRVLLDLRPRKAQFEGRYYPPMLIAFSYPLPGLLSGINYTETILWQAMEYIPLSNTPAREGEHIITTFTPLALLKTCAKIAYSFAIAEKGPEYFDSTDIRELILQRRTDVHNFAGSSQEPRFKGERLHWLSCYNDKGYLVVKVHLFASFSLMPFIVVVGQIR